MSFARHFCDPTAALRSTCKPFCRVHPAWHVNASALLPGISSSPQQQGMAATIVSQRGALVKARAIRRRFRKQQTADEDLEDTASKGFGRSSSNAMRRKVQKNFDAEEDEGDEGEEMELQKEYQLYVDPEYVPPRVVGNVEVATIEGKGRGLVVTAESTPGDLLILSPALAFLEGTFGEAPEPEDLQVSMLEDGLTSAQRRVLDVLFDGSEASTAKATSLTTMDVKFWSSRGKDLTAPTVDAKRLLKIITECACSDTQQDAATMQVRHQKPVGFIGLWPEFSLLNHSCVPNTCLTVIKDRMLVHAGKAMARGEELTRNYIGQAVTAPLELRQMVLQDSFDFGCACPRCRLEAGVSEQLRETLQDAYVWYTEEALPQWQAANESGDSEALTSLYQEAVEIVAEVEQAVAQEPGLDEEQQLWLKSSCYDCYDMLVMCDEFVNQEDASPDHVRSCLELIRTFAPGSENHTTVAVKYDAIMRNKAQMAEFLLSQKNMARPGRAARRQLQQLQDQADLASAMYLEAFLCRYGVLDLQMLETLREGLEMYIEALEQMSLMQAAGQTESSNDYDIDGVTVSIIDKLEVSNSPSSSYGRGSSPNEFEVTNQDGIRLSFIDSLPTAEIIDIDNDSPDQEEDDDSDIIDIEVQDLINQASASPRSKDPPIGVPLTPNPDA